MAEGKKSFVLYCDLIHVVKKLVEQDRINKTNYSGELFLHVLEYVNDTSPIPVNFIVDMAFEPIKQQLKRDLLKWSGERVLRVESGKLGGIKSGETRRKAINVKQNEANEASASKAKQTQANEAVNVSVTVNDNVNVISNKQPSRDALILPENVGDEFLRTWEDLIKQKKWKKKSPSALKYSLKILEKYSEVEGIEMMSKAIAGDWQGLVEPQNNFKNGNFKQNNASGSATEALKNW